MTTVSTPHCVNQSTSRCRSAVKVPKLRTGSGVRSALTAAMCMVAPVDGSRVRVHHRHLTAVPRLRSFGVHLQFLLLTPAEGLGCAIHQIPNRDRRDGVTTFKRATAHGPGFLTGSHATKIVS